MARALNGVGPDGAGGPTPSPCGVCAQCTAIAQDRHVDVIEMDAASRTGVGDIRELIEGVRYRPVQARYKIYIIDEVHMLSNQAFRSEEHTSELQSLMRISYAVFFLNKKTNNTNTH